MKRGTYVLIIVLLFFILFVATLTSFIYFEFRKAPTVKTRSYLEMDLSGTINEKSEPDFRFKQEQALKYQLQIFPKVI